MFHDAKVSFAWHAALESTRRNIPFPGFTHAARTPEGLADSFGANTIENTITATPRHTTHARRIKALLITFSFEADASRIKLKAPQFSHLELGCQKGKRP